MAYTQQTFADGQVLTAAQLNQMSAGIAGKVDSVAGKGLSTNDFTNEEKQKLAGLATGLDGATYTPAVSAEGVLSWTNDKGKANPAAVNIRGPQGADGAPLTVVSVEASSVDGGENVIVLSDGTRLIVLNGSKGSRGAAGAQGPEGPSGPSGPAGTDGAAGKDGVSASHSWNGTTLTITSASGASSANLKGDKGDKGDKGESGADGVHILDDGETLDDAPQSADVVIDPNGIGFESQTWTFTMTDGSVVNMEVFARVV